jgi:UDP-glucose 4-epimerase
MLKHLNDKINKPKRVVILGAKGFVGKASATRLAEQGVSTLLLGREELDLCDKKASEKLATMLRPDDALVMIAAKAPCKNHLMLLENIEMMTVVCDALVKAPVAHVLYISSDAVYADSMAKLSEHSPTAPTSLHGVMHLAREIMLQSVVKADALVILRASLLYGANDPHNGYGPNSFMRRALSGKPIELFGQGEERRDHVYIDDVAELISLCLFHRSSGVLNITTATVASFNEIASLIGDIQGGAVEIKHRPRTGPMPHNGYRAFDNKTCAHAFATFKYTSLLEGLKKMHTAFLVINEGSVHAGN